MFESITSPCLLRPLWGTHVYVFRLPPEKISATVTYPPTSSPFSGRCLQEYLSKCAAGVCCRPFRFANNLVRTQSPHYDTCLIPRQFGVSHVCRLHHEVAALSAGYRRRGSHCTCSERVVDAQLTSSFELRHAIIWCAIKRWSLSSILPDPRQLAESHVNRRHHIAVPATHFSQ